MISCLKLKCKLICWCQKIKLHNPLIEEKKSGLIDSKIPDLARHFETDFFYIYLLTLPIFVSLCPYVECLAANLLHTYTIINVQTEKNNFKKRMPTRFQFRQSKWGHFESLLSWFYCYFAMLRWNLLSTLFFNLILRKEIWK